MNLLKLKGLRGIKNKQKTPVFVTDCPKIGLVGRTYIFFWCIRAVPRIKFNLINLIKEKDWHCQYWLTKCVCFHKITL